MISFSAKPALTHGASINNGKRQTGGDKRPPRQNQARQHPHPRRKASFLGAGDIENLCVGSLKPGLTRHSPFKHQQNCITFTNWPRRRSLKPSKGEHHRTPPKERGTTLPRRIMPESLNVANHRHQVVRCAQIWLAQRLSASAVLNAPGLETPDASCNLVIREEKNGAAERPPWLWWEI